MTDPVEAAFARALEDIVAELARTAPLSASAALADAGFEGLRIGAAVSGGGDSMALLHLMLRSGLRPVVATVDHRLRPESAEEAAWVAARCRDLGLDHDILIWKDWDGRGNLQDAARRARRRLLADWARARGADLVALGHTLDDQAETVLMRLARGSGVDGLSAMAPVRRDDGLTWVRPLLDVPRAALREWLVGQGLEWRDDPGNEDPRFDRVKMRRLLPVLAGAGLTPTRLAETAAAMRRARQALEAATMSLAKRAAEPSELGDVTFDLCALEAASEEIALRLFAHGLGWVSAAPYRPRLSALRAVLRAGEGTLHGCLLRRQGTRLLVRREPARTGDPVPAGEIWDGRWRTAGPAVLTVRALGEEGLAQCPDWRDSGHARETLLSTPGFWRGPELVASPFLTPDPECRASLKDGVPSFFARIIRR